MLNHVTLEHQIKSFDLEDKNIPLTFKMEKKKKKPYAALLVLQLIRPLAGSNLSLLRQKKKK